MSMKVEYIDIVERHIAWNRKMYCPSCGGHEYEVVEQWKPVTFEPWFVRCPQCGAIGLESTTRKMAIARWKQL